VIENLALGEAKTKAYRAALNAIDVKRTALIVENSQSLSPALILGVRNLEGVELMLNNEVHPYDLLRYDRAVFSRAALEQLQETLKKTVSKRKQRARAQAEVA
jgi:large subunit ribosomal protein L4